jgi:hypothetical protein
MITNSIASQQFRPVYTARMLGHAQADLSLSATMLLYLCLPYETTTHHLTMYGVVRQVRASNTSYLMGEPESGRLNTIQDDL